MSSEITTAFVEQYSSLVFHLSQQKGSRLRPAVRNEMQRGKSAFYDRIGQTTVYDITTRHGDTVLNDTPHSRRRVTLIDKGAADMVDEQDKVRTLIQPDSQYALSQAWALGRAMDDKIISEALGTAYGGSDGSTTVTWPNSQKRVIANAGTVGLDLSVEGLRIVGEVLDAADVDPSIPRYFIGTSSQKYSLLADTEATSSDYATIKALVNGQINEYMGFNFIWTERLNTQSGTLNFGTDNSVGSGSGDADGFRRCIALASDGVLFAQALAMKSSITERPDKNMNIQVFTRASFGATRMEEEKVVELLCNEG